MAPSNFTTAWLEHCADIRSDGVEPQVSANRLRRLIQSKLLEYDDVRTNPAKFFEAHRRLVDPSVRGSPGFWIRFTVQFNLFAGTVMGLGNEAQRNLLKDFQSKGTLGCFALTERFAGVNSGLIVRTTATWSNEKGKFVIHSPDEGAYKNWISQGLFADKAAVIADLIVEGKSHGPHGFLIDLRRDGAVVKGVTLGDMGRKSTANDLDNAWIAFDNVEVDPSTLLSRFAEVQNGKYVQTTKEKMRIEIIGQRLLSGRVAVAQAALATTRKIFDMTKSYADSKKCWAVDGKVNLSSIPHIQALFQEGYKTLAELDDYLGRVERALCETLQRDGIPSPQLVEAIAVGKISAVERSIDICFRLKQEVGSYALMGGTGFEHLDFLQCCKFAEGDSRILMLKLARDRLRAYSKEKQAGDPTELALCARLAAAGKSAFETEWRTVFELSDAICRRTMSTWSVSSKL